MKLIHKIATEICIYIKQEKIFRSLWNFVFFFLLIFVDKDYTTKLNLTPASSTTDQRLQRSEK